MQRKNIISKNGHSNTTKKKKSRKFDTNIVDKKIPGIVAITEYQKVALKEIHKNSITFLSGPAGSGKTFLAVHYGIIGVLKKQFDSLILTRPCVEAYGEKLGSLPGDADDKIAPYMSPMLHLLATKYSNKEIEQWINDKLIVFQPIAFLRGFTFNDCFVVADEMQNATPQQMRLVLTRLGENCKIVVTGAVLQSDIKGINGFSDAMDRLKDIEGIGFVDMPLDSIVRNPLIKTIEKKYLSEK